MPEEEWFIVENTHEAIIDRETFDKVQGLLKRDTRTAPKQKQLYLFSGFLKCADCGRAMSRIASKGIYVTIERSFRRSLRAMSPPLNPNTMENGPVIKRLGNTVRRYFSLSLSSSSALEEIVLQKGAAITLAASCKDSFCLRSR